MKIVAITQARIGSSRLPGKVLLKIQDKSLLEIHLTKVLKSKKIDKLIVATTFENDVIKIIDICNKSNVLYYQGSMTNVLERFYKAIEHDKPDYVVRITSDCPLIDAKLIDEVIEFAVDHNFDYASNTLNPTYPDGFDVEVFKFSALEKAYLEAENLLDKEHVTPYIWRNSNLKGGGLFFAGSYENAIDYSNFRVTVDEQSDFELVKALIEQVGDETWLNYTNYLIENPSLIELNNSIKRNEGFDKSIKKDYNG